MRAELHRSSACVQPQPQLTPCLCGAATYVSVGSPRTYAHLANGQALAALHAAVLTGCWNEQESTKAPRTTYGAGAQSVPQTRPPPVQQMHHHQQPATAPVTMGYPQQQQQQQAASGSTMPAMDEPLKPARNQYPTQPAGYYQ